MSQYSRILGSHVPILVPVPFFPVFAMTTATNATLMWIAFRGWPSTNIAQLRNSLVRQQQQVLSLPQALQLNLCSEDVRGASLGSVDTC
ncbi:MULTISPECIES: hypothetical protein [unclassified Luteimonas]